jgi:hypothetical protein
MSNIEILDEIRITAEERKEIDYAYAKKNLYYMNKIKNNHNTTKSLFYVLKSLRNFYITFKSLKLRYLTNRLKMLESIMDGNDHSVNAEIEEIKVQITKNKNSIDYINKYVGAIRKEIIDLNDLMITL